MFYHIAHLLFISALNIYPTAELTNFYPRTLQAVILAGGQSNRFKSDKTKLVAEIAGKPIVTYVAELTHRMSIPTTVLAGYQKELVKESIDRVNIPHIAFFSQDNLQGGAYDLLMFKDQLTADNILVLMGDMPFISPQIINKLVEEHNRSHAAITISTSRKDYPMSGFGRFVQKENILKIVEEKDFIDNPKEYPYVNTGVYVFDRKFLQNYLRSIKQKKNTKQFHINSLVEIASKNKLPIRLVEFPFHPHFYGINTLEELEFARQIQQREFSSVTNLTKQ